MDISLYRMIPQNARDSVFVNSVPLMNVISHEIEDVVFDNQLRVDFFAGFQRFSFFTRQIKRYTRLASVCRRVYVWGVPDIDPPAIPGVEYLPLHPDQALAREWFLVVDTPTFFTALLTQETTYGQDVPKGYRRFEGIWTYDSDIVSRAHLLVSQLLGANYPGVSIRDYEQQSKHLVQISNRLVQRQDKQATREVLALHHSSLLQAGMAHIDLPLLVLDANRTVITVSLAAGVLFGLEPEQFAGQPMAAIADGALAQVPLEPVRESTAVSVSINGQPMYANVSSILHENSTTVMGWVVTLQPEAARPNTASSITNVPVVPVLQRYLSGMQQLIMMLPSLNTRPDVQQRVIAQMQRLVSEANTLVERMSLVQQIESQPLTDLGELDLRVLAQQVLQEWQATASQYQAELAATADAIKVRGNQGLLQQALRELLDNVAQHAQGNQAWVQLVARDGSVMLVVQDNGVGIDPGDMAHLFEPHYQAGNGNGKTVRRVGLGLSLARAIARAHSGALEAESEVGRGSTFRLVLPA